MKTAPLGAAQYFHIFANTTTLRAHTDGNIATGLLNAQVNFGTNVHTGGITQDISYLKTIQQIQSSSFISSTASRSNKVVIGPTVAAWLRDNNNQPGVFILNHDTKMGHLLPGELYRDSAVSPYLDIQATLTKAASQGATWSQQPTTTGTSSDFSDINNRWISAPTTTQSGYAIKLTKTDPDGNPLAGARFDLYKAGQTTPLRRNLETGADGTVAVTGLESPGDYYFVETAAPQGYELDATPHAVTVTAANNIATTDTTFVDIDAETLATYTPLTIKNLSTTGSTVVMNVNLHGASQFTVNSAIKLIIDGQPRSNQENDHYTDAKILWNFYNGGANPELTINAPFQGSILAPTATVTANQNVDGSIIADTVNINAESHRWDPQLTGGATGTPATLTIVNHKQAVATTDISGQKTWVDQDDAAGIRPQSITIQLHRNGQIIATTTANAASKWRYLFSALPVSDENGTPYTYSVSELPVAGYISSQNGFDFTNTLQPAVPVQPRTPTTPTTPVLPSTPTTPVIPTQPITPTIPQLPASKAPTEHASIKQQKKVTQRQRHLPQTGDDTDIAMMAAGLILLSVILLLVLLRY